ALEEAAKRKMRFVVLDRPNPIRGDVVEGDLLDPDIKRMTGYFLIPVRHGFTVGELAHWMNENQHLGADLTIVRMRGWHRNEWYDATGLPFVPPSPNIPDPTAALLYSGIGCFEATNMAVGRGTGEPFRLFGAPWLDASGLTAYLRQLNLKGILFETTDFVPAKDIYAGQTCHGVRMIVTDRNAVSPFEIFVASFLWIVRAQPKEFRPVWEEVRVVTGSERLHEAADGGWRLDDLLAYYRQRAEEFKRAAAPFHLY
ncbi:MAG: DUF1343 domain-containing protein, partial [Elusimicrobia bacterium]|nr:DUF1343 domain-containing protein [Elusimicrobiota bacterium]